MKAYIVDQIVLHSHCLPEHSVPDLRTVHYTVAASILFLWAVPVRDVGLNHSLPISARRARFASDTMDAGTDAVGTSDASTCWHRLSTAGRGERHSYLRRSLRGPKLLDALADLGRWTIEIVTRPQSIGTFKPEPRRWVAERTFAWLGRNRRLADATVALLKTSKRPSPAPRPGS